MSICCLLRGEVTFFPFILKMAVSSADEMRDGGEPMIGPSYTMYTLCYCEARRLQNMISSRSQSLIVVSTCHRVPCSIFSNDAN